MATNRNNYSGQEIVFPWIPANPVQLLLCRISKAAKLGQMEQTLKMTNESEAEQRYDLEGLKKLYQKCLSFKSGQLYPCLFFYRDKSMDYFMHIRFRKCGIMEKYLKTFHGDPKSPINGILEGLFFSTYTDPKTNMPWDKSIFGDVRLFIPPLSLVSPNHRLYFADFFCITHFHYIVLVLTLTNTAADEYCRRHLLPLDIINNPFLRLNPWNFTFSITHSPVVHVFYTENIDINRQLIGGGASFCPVQMTYTCRPGMMGLRKNASCKLCNFGVDEK